MEKINGIDEYINTLPALSQDKISSLRALVHKLFPQAAEAIKYGVPTYILQNKNLVHFAAFKKHIGIYPGPEIIKSFSQELINYPTSKGAIQFALENPLPLPLIKKIIKQRALNIKAEAAQPKVKKV